MAASMKMTNHDRLRVASSLDEVYDMLAGQAGRMNAKSPAGLRQSRLMSAVIAAANELRRAAEEA